MIKGLVNRIIPFSSVDGPGNRTAVFLQGCNYNCLYCHNPETIDHCNQCGTCVNTCPYNALFLKDNKVVWNKELCENCDECLKSCPRNSCPKVKEMSIDDVIIEINKIKPFISGITVSGGECTLQVEFLIALFKEVKKMGLTAFVDTNGSKPLWKNKELIEVMDMAMIDVKSFEPKEHKILTGMDNSTVLENVKYLAEINKLYEVRTVIVPEVLDNYNNVDKISRLIAELNPNIRYKIIKYRPIGVRTELLDSYTPSEDMMQELSDLAIKNGCKNIVLI